MNMHTIYMIYIFTVFSLCMVVPVHGGQSDCSRNTRQASTQNLQACLTELKQAVLSTPVSPVVTATSGVLTVYPELTYMADDVTYDNLCCRTEALQGGTVTLNPLSSTRNRANLFKNKPSITFDVTDTNLKDASNYYTIGIFDSTDVMNSNLLSFDKPFLHWLNINVRGLDMSTGEQLVTYQPTATSNNYGFLVMKQAGVMLTFNESKYFMGCRGCNFDITQIVKDYSLQPIGVSIIRPQPNLYTVALFQAFGFTEEESCRRLLPDLDLDCLSDGHGIQSSAALVIIVAVTTTMKPL